MKFYVIYSVDCPRSQSIKQYLPSRSRHWQQTEGDSEYEYSYLEGQWKKGKHRKLVGLLSREEFDRFVSSTGMFAEDAETMGSLTFEGWFPAISFRADDYDAIRDAYVTPIPEINGHEIKSGNERHWNMIRQAVVNHYG